MYDILITRYNLILDFLVFSFKHIRFCRNYNVSAHRTINLFFLGHSKINPECSTLYFLLGAFLVLTAFYVARHRSSVFLLFLGWTFHIACILGPRPEKTAFRCRSDVSARLLCFHVPFARFEQVVGVVVRVLESNAGWKWFLISLSVDLLQKRAK